MTNMVSASRFPWRSPLSADWSGRWAALDRRVRALDEHSEPAEYGAIAIEARRLANQALGPHENLKLEHLARRMLPGAERFKDLRHFRLGLIGNRTLSYLVAPLRAAGLSRGLLIEAVEVPYDLAIAMAVGPTTTFDGRPFDTSVIVLDEAAFPGSRVPLDLAHEADAFSDAEVFLERLIRGICGAVGAPAIVATMPATESNVSSSELALPGSTPRLLVRLNNMISDGAGRRDWIIWDLAALASRVGIDNWIDSVRFHEAKIPFRIELGPLVADHLCRTLAAIAGKSCRALVFDLDNTIWGGVVGDDGVSGIRLGQNSAEGEAYLAFQRFLLTLRQRGVVLAVCSRNTDAIAREPFRKHPEMLLREEHIAIFQANWEDKATNLKAIAEALNLGLESIAFADDNAAERERVRQELPLVSVIEIGDEPALFSARIADSGVFEHLPLTADDRSRAASYQTRAASAELRTRIGNHHEYLRSLNMKLSVSRFDEVGRSRIVQLINKSNQFNLTTRRYNEIQVRDFEENVRDILCWQARLEDAFGQHGVIGVVIVRKLQEDWEIDTWLMSCRVVARGIEETLMNVLMAEARSAGARGITAEYVPTQRNGLVADLYPRLGFSRVKADAIVGSRFRAYPDSHPRLKSFIEVERL
jgi:FkbH-like protein